MKLDRYELKAINKYFEIVSEDFDIMGVIEEEWEEYEKGKNYQAFAARRKKCNLRL